LKSIIGFLSVAFFISSNLLAETVQKASPQLNEAELKLRREQVKIILDQMHSLALSIQADQSKEESMLRQLNEDIPAIRDYYKKVVDSTLDKVKSGKNVKIESRYHEDDANDELNRNLCRLESDLNILQKKGRLLDYHIYSSVSGQSVQATVIAFPKDGQEKDGIKFTLPTFNFTAPESVVKEKVCGVCGPGLNFSCLPNRGRWDDKIKSEKSYWSPVDGLQDKILTGDRVLQLNTWAGELKKLLDSVQQEQWPYVLGEEKPVSESKKLHSHEAKANAQAPVKEEVLP
jgi:hypothetical protein